MSKSTFIRELSLHIGETKRYLYKVKPKAIFKDHRGFHQTTDFVTVFIRGTSDSVKITLYPADQRGTILSFEQLPGSVIQQLLF